jgi:hypothetical protein
MDLSLIIDIESGHVRAALAAQNPSKANAWMGTPRTILYSTAVPIARTPHTVQEHLIMEMTKSLGVAVDAAFHKGLQKIPKGKIVSIHYVLSSPWIITKTRTVQVSYPKKTIITKKIVEALVEAERKSLEQSFVERDVAGIEFDLTCIEQKVFEIKLDGYPVVSLAVPKEGGLFKSKKRVPKKATQLEVSFAVTMSSAHIVRRIEETVEKTLRIKDQSFHSALLLLYASVRNVFNEAKDYIVAHVHGELSDVVLVHDNMYSLIASFPFGTSTFVRSSAHAADESETLMKSMLALHSSGALHGKHHEKIAKAASPSVRSWSTQLSTSISGARKGRTPFPNTVFLFAHDHHVHFERALEEEAGNMKIDIIPFKQDALLDMYALALKNIEHHE